MRKTARRQCVEEGAHLAVIDTQLKFEQVMRQSGNHSYEGLHVGIHGMSSNGVWVSVVDGSTLTNLPWANEKPNTAGDTVVATKYPRGLSNYVINSRGLAVCELPIPEN